MKRPLTIRLCEPRGFCAGVDRAIQIVVLALKRFGAPVYVRHEIVHNRFVVEGLEAKGAVFVEELDEIPAEHRMQPVVFSAHGVPKSVPADAQARNLFYLDATCPLVSKVHKQAMRHQRLGRHVVLIGHAGHPEVIGTMGQLEPGAVSLIETVEDADRYEPADPENLGYVTQTTLSVDDTAGVIARLQERFPKLTAPAADSICYATTNRQEAVKHAARLRPLPDRRSAELLQFQAPRRSRRKGRREEIAARPARLRNRLGQSGGCFCCRPVSGASAPEVIVNEIIAAFKARFDATVDLAITAEENEHFLVNRELRDVELTAADMAFVNG